MENTTAFFDPGDGLWEYTTCHQQQMNDYAVRGWEVRGVFPSGTVIMGRRLPKEKPMAVIGDWVAKAAEEIWDRFETSEMQDMTLEEIHEVIQRHCPFKPNTAYVEAQTSIQYTRKDSL